MTKRTRIRVKPEPYCPECGAIMVLRRPKRGQDWTMRGNKSHPYFHGFGLFAFPGPPVDHWSFGWLTGRDSDLICVKRDVVGTIEGNPVLSPVCTTPLLAILGFLLKRMLVAVDLNLAVEDRPAD